MARFPVAALLLALPLGVPCAAQPVSEYAAKVDLLAKFTRFVEWPPDSPVRDPAKAFVLGVVGRSPFGDELDQHFLKQTLKGKPVQIRYCRNPGDVESCDMLFICASEKERLGDLLARVRQRPVLTVADTAGFVHAGVMVGLIKDGGKLTFEVGLPPAKALGIRFSPGFLQIARIVAP